MHTYTCTGQMIEGSQLSLRICMPSYVMKHNMITFGLHPLTDGPCTAAFDLHHLEVPENLVRTLQAPENLATRWCAAHYHKIM